MKPIPRAVTVFGGGVTGLTVAHELIERGYQVEVWEPAEDERAPARGATVGGMARTQWAAAPWPETFSEPKGPVDWKAIEARRIEHIETEFYEIEGSWVSSSRPQAGPVTVIDAESVSAITKQLSAYASANGKMAVVYAECLVLGTPTTTDAALQAAERRVHSLLTTHFKLTEDGDELLHSVTGENRTCRVLVRAIDCPSTEAVPDGTKIILRFRKREHWIPGEHGYRFFPSFYQHVFDTMKRTPILTPRLKSGLNEQQERAAFRSASADAHPEPYTYVETGKTVFDNLISAESHALAFNDNRAPLTFPRYRLGSLVAAIRHWRVAMEKLDFAPRDLARFSLRLQEYALLSDERRRRLDGITWWDFIGGNEKDYYTRSFRYRMARWSEGLIAMDAEECDAHSYGSIILQLLFDQSRDEEDYRDGILNGPTSVAWFDPWRRYLEAQGVRFIHGKLKGFKRRSKRDGSYDLWPDVECWEPRYPGALALQPKLLDGYFVVATSLGAAQEAAKSITDAVGEETIKKDGDARDVGALVAREKRFANLDTSKPRPSGDLRHFAGVQYYFREDLSWVHGHMYYPDSPWGLSSISQARYWQEKQDWEHGYRGVMSVIISSWDVRSPETNKTAWEATPDELAAEVWRQVSEGIRGERDARLGEVDSDEMLQIPKPIFWHLDQRLVHADGKYTNETPFQINLPKEWDERPGALGPNGYAVLRNVVFAGTYMRTYTRINSMETANESGRHAVNGILTHQYRNNVEKGEARRASKLCKTFPIKHREPMDLGFFKAVDKRLYELEGRYPAPPSSSLTTALGLDGLTALLPKRRS